MRASRETTRRVQRNPQRFKMLGDLSSVRVWRRRNDDSSRVGRLEVRSFSPATASSPGVGDSHRESPPVAENPPRESHPSVGLIQACGLVVLVCAGALAIFAGWGRTDLVQLAAIFAVVGIGLVVASLWRHSSTVEAAPPGEKASRPRVRSKRTTAPPWATLDQRVQRLVSQLEETFKE